MNNTITYNEILLTIISQTESEIKAGRCNESNLKEIVKELVEDEMSVYGQNLTWLAQIASSNTLLFMRNTKEHYGEKLYNVFNSVIISELIDDTIRDVTLWDYIENN